MPKKVKSNNNILLVAIFIIVFISGYSIYTLYIENQKQTSLIQLLGNQLSENAATIANLNIKVGNLTLETNGLKSELRSKELTISDLSQRLGITQSELEELTPIVKDYFALGVSNDNKGVLIPLEVKMEKGTGRVAVNIKNIDLQAGAQDSVRTATKVAEDYTDADLSEKDITVTFVNDNPFIVSLDGPSAGAAITLTIIAGILEKTPSDEVLITGTIEEDGSVGPVGGVQEKGLAAASYGADIFLVPFGQKTNIGGIEVAEVKKIQEVVNLVLK